MNYTLKTLVLAAAVALVPAMAGAQDFYQTYEKADQARIEQNLAYNGPVQGVWKDADSFIYSNHEQDGDKVYEVNVKTKSKKVVSEQELNELRQRYNRPYYDPSDESEYYHRRDNRSFKSPDGTAEAYIKDNNVWVKKDGQEKQLSFDGSETYPYERIMWSPDSKKIAASKKQVLKERQILLRTSRPDTQVQPTYRWLDYAKPGDTLPQTEVALLNVETGAVRVDNAPFANQYSLYLGQWSPDSEWFTFEYNQRGHQVYQLVAVNARDGRTRVLADENTAKYDYKFIYYNDLYRYYFKDGKRILWISERDGYRHLYIVDPVSARNTQLTSGEWNVREIHEVNEAQGYILFSANGLNEKKGEDPYNKHVCKLFIKSGEIVDLTPENAFHTPIFSRDFTCFIDNYSRPDLPNTAVVRSSSDGSIMMEIQKQDISALLKKGFTMPEVFVAKGRDGKTDIWGTIYRPRNYKPGKKYPVIEYIYAGPHDSHVEKVFSCNSRNITLCELGYVVVTIDGMGTDNRSRKFQDVCWQNIKDAGFPDRILWIQAAAKKYKNLDISNVGIYGYSAGGQNTLAALLFHPEFYKVGVALCGCHDNRMDKIWWNEQWMGYPIGPWYSENSNVDNADKLQGKLFIINGEVDDNVDPASSLQVVAELIKNDKDFEQLYLPGYSHNLGAKWITRKMFEYFYKNIPTSSGNASGKPAAPKK
ncbi:MAG: S9 family peptidase [Bacteroidales bacterium]|nr:S9 family peptidase [Bacteroidales bacterium]